MKLNITHHLSGGDMVIAMFGVGVTTLATTKAEHRGHDNDEQFGTVEAPAPTYDSGAYPA